MRLPIYLALALASGKVYKFVSGSEFKRLFALYLTERVDSNMLLGKLC